MKILFFKLNNESLKLLQVLLKPIVSQVMVEPPESLESFLDVPTLEEVDETLVLCLGQMAVTAQSDVLCKPLNHEVRIEIFFDCIRLGKDRYVFCII